MKRRYKVMWIMFSVIFILTLAGVIFFIRPSFGSAPRGERLERIQKSPNYRDGKFHNKSPTRQLTSDKGFLGEMWSFLFRKEPRVTPDGEIPVMKTDIRAFSPKGDILVWLGHGSYYLQTDGKRFVVDPVFYNASPVSFYNREFRGTGQYKPGDLPDIDYFIISHDHWDHLDHRTVKEMNPRTAMFICPLGVGAHLERWGVPVGKIMEMDWYESETLDMGITIHCLPARHFSGRGLRPNRTLWALYMLETPSGRIFMGGDGGYDTHFAEIGERFAPIDLAILENGQYGDGWKYIHLLPDDLLKAIADLSPRRVLTVHNSKYALARHPWDEPLELVNAAAERDCIELLTPMIGEPVDLRDTAQVFSQWWKINI